MAAQSVSDRFNRVVPEYPSLTLRAVVLVPCYIAVALK